MKKSAVLSAIEIHGDPKLGMDQTNVKKSENPCTFKICWISRL